MNNYFIKPNVLCIGHMCHDLYGDDFILGGTASYASLVFRRLGLHPAVLTSTGPDFKFFDLFEKKQIPIHNKMALKTTVFENIYGPEGRTQYMHSRAETLFAEDLPKEWSHIPIVKFCLIADEADPSLVKAFPNSLVAATIQGWLRQWDEKGKISPKAMDWSLFEYIDIVLMSSDDIKGFETSIPKIVDQVDILVVTRGNLPAAVYHNQKKEEYPAFPVREVDPTGAGDVFAASFITRYAETQSIEEATAFAHCAAAFVIEGLGLSNLPGLEAIIRRVNKYRDKFLTGK